MDKAIKLLLGIIACGILLGILFGPFAILVAGISLWVILYVAQGGMADGNPYKRMNMGGGVPNWSVVNQYQKNQDIELRDSGSYNTAVFFFLAGLILMGISLAWAWLNGTFS